MFYNIIDTILGRGFSFILVFRFTGGAYAADYVHSSRFAVQNSQFARLTLTGLSERLRRNNTYAHGGISIMASPEIFEKVKKIIVDQLDVDEAKVTEDASIIDDLGADSLDVVDLVMAFEEEFEVEIPDDKVEGIKVVGDVVKLIAEKE